MACSSIPFVGGGAEQSEGSDFTTAFTNATRGDKGDADPEGPAGPEGPDGRRGEQGDTGPRGELGPQGPLGPEGPLGPVNPQDEIGAAGPFGVDDTIFWHVLAVIEPDDPPMHFAISDNGQRLYTVSPFENSIAIYDTTDLQLTAYRTSVARLLRGW